MSKDLHTDLGLKEEDLIEMYRYMVAARLCDERQWGLNRQGKAPFVVPVSGHEAAQVGSGWAFERGKDVFCPYYRDMALVLVAGFTPKDVFLGLFGKADDPSSGGRQMPAHWGARIVRQYADHIEYVTMRPDVERVLPAGYVSPAIK